MNDSQSQGPFLSNFLTGEFDFEIFPQSICDPLNFSEIDFNQIPILDESFIFNDSLSPSLSADSFNSISSQSSPSNHSLPFDDFDPLLNDHTLAYQATLKGVHNPRGQDKPKRVSSFNETLPPELALKRRRTSSKKEITLEILEKASHQEDPNLDPAAAKRKKNTDAARRSRLRKALKMDTLESQISTLEKDNVSLTTQVAVLENENHHLRNLQIEYLQRIQRLEDQLLEAHKSLAHSK